MGTMVSPAGDMEIKVAAIDTADNQMVITGQLGVWDAKIYFGPVEICHLIRLMMKWSIIKYVISLPCLYFTELRKQKKN